MSTARIPLSRGLEAIVSVEDLDLAMSRKWYAGTVSPAKTYAMRTETRNGRRTAVYLHRLIAGAAEGQLIDHANGNTLDNRRENLRIADATLNCVNKRHYKPASGYRGVYQVGQRFRATLWARRARYCGGTHDTPEDAALAYDRLAIAHFGEFAVLNFPERRSA